VVQADSLPITLQENLKDLCTIIYAYNGAGKTLAFLIPILNSLEMIPYQCQQKSRSSKESDRFIPQAIIVFPTEALMSQVFEYLQAYANYYECKLKWPLKIGRIYGNVQEKGHIIVGLSNKICQSMNWFDFSELKWVVFDECDKIKDDTSGEFKQILNLFSANNVTANVAPTYSVHHHLCHRREGLLPQLHPAKPNHP
jgi:superfamily II DNA/RNA helicase